MSTNRSEKIKVIFYGVGAIGSEVARFGLTRPWLEAVGAVDTDPAKIGHDLGEVLNLGQKLGVEVSGDPAALFKRVKADVVVLTTGSFLPAIYDQLEMAVRAGLNIVTSAEELAFPTLQSAKLAEQLDGLAKDKGITSATMIVSISCSPPRAFDSAQTRIAASISRSGNWLSRRIRVETCGLKPALTSQKRLWNSFKTDCP